MPTRPKDTTLTNRFTPTIHSKPKPSLKPVKNPLPPALNILIIGASRGIGAAIAHAYALAGASTLLLAARPSSSTELHAVAEKCQELNPKCRTVCLDVDITCAESVRQLAGRVREELVGRKRSDLDICILNSGYSGPVVLKVTDGFPEDFKHVCEVNLLGTYLVAREVVPVLLSKHKREEEEEEEEEEKGARGGLKMFVTVGSFAGLIVNGHIANTAYCVSKFAQTRLVEFVAEQFGGEGVLAVAVHPGAVNTEMADRTTPESFRPYLTDDVGLCGAFCVWMTRERERLQWMNGRLMSATWDVDELVNARKEIEEQDLLKFGFRTGNISAALN